MAQRLCTELAAAGLHSLVAVRLAARAQKQGIPITSAKTILEHRTIEELADALELFHADEAEYSYGYYSDHAGAAEAPASKPASKPKEEAPQREARPCNSYKLNIRAKRFGECRCGWPKEDHK